MKAFFQSKTQPFSLLSNPFPFPTYLVDQEMNKLPPKYQNQNTYLEIKKQNDRAIYQRFEEVLGNATHGMSDPSELSKNELGYRLCSNLRDRDQYGNLYAEYVQKFTSDPNNIHLQNYMFYKQALNQILMKHSEIFSIYPIPDHYYSALRSKLDKKKKKSGFLSCFSARKEVSHEDQDINQVLIAEQNAKNLRNGINNQHHHHHHKKTQGPSFNSTDLIISKTFLSSTSGNKIEYNEQTFNKLAQIQQNKAETMVLKDGDTSRLSYYQAYKMNHLMGTITLDHTKMISRKPYIESAFNYLTSCMHSIKTKADENKTFEELCKKVYNALSFESGYYGEDNWGDDNKYYEIESWMIVMIHIYKSLEKGYDSYRRRVLKILFVAFTNKDLLHPVEVLRWLENHRPEILKLNNTETYADVISNSEALLKDIHQNKLKLNFLQDKIPSQIPKLSLVHLSDKKLPRRKTVNIWVSGFLSEDMSKDSQWGELLDYMPDSEAYALQWESDTIINLVKFMGTSCKDLLTGKSIKEQLNKKFADNPFIPAFETAKYSGRYLAQMALRVFPDQFINIAGYSLGSELIKEFLERFIEVGAQDRLSNIYMMGGVTDRNQLAGIIRRAKYPLCIYNCYTNNDMVLKYVLCQCKPDFETIGLNEIPHCDGHEVVNVDVSSIISGHLAYMSEFDIVGKMLDMDKQ